jgi:hypothetical protein
MVLTKGFMIEIYKKIGDKMNNLQELNLILDEDGFVPYELEFSLLYVKSFGIHQAQVMLYPVDCVVDILVRDLETDLRVSTTEYIPWIYSTKVDIRSWFYNTLRGLREYLSNIDE